MKINKFKEPCKVTGKPVTYYSAYPEAPCSEDEFNIYGVRFKKDKNNIIIYKMEEVQLEDSGYIYRVSSDFRCRSTVYVNSYFSNKIKAVEYIKNRIKLDYDKITASQEEINQKSKPA